MANDPQPTGDSGGRARGPWGYVRVAVVLGFGLKALAFAGVFGYVALTHSIEQALPLLIGPVLGVIGLYALLKWRRRRAQDLAADVLPTAPGDPAPSPVEDDVAA